MKYTAKLALVLLLFCAFVPKSTAYTADKDERFCHPDDKCYVEIHSQNHPMCRMEHHNQFIHYMRPQDGGVHRIPTACARSNIFGGDGYLVAYPSRGGVVLIKDPPAVDLKYLGLPNTHDTARPADGSSDAEDDLATRMLRLGADWWPDWDTYFRHFNNVKENHMFYSYHFPSKVEAAFPTTGGAWVGNFTRDVPRHMFSEVYGEAVCDSWLPYTPSNWSKKIRYSLTMDDKAEVMQALGATFHESADEIPGLPRTVDEAVTLFEPFRKRLSDMDDPAYRKTSCQRDPDLQKSHVRIGDDQAPNETPQKPRWGIWSLFPELR